MSYYRRYTNRPDCLQSKEEYFAELRRKANANLSVSARERRAKADEAARRKAERADAKAAQRAHVAFLRDERARLRTDLKGLDDSEADVRADSFFNSDPGRLQGALEEIDALRDSLNARIWRIESDLRRAGR